MASLKKSYIALVRSQSGAYLATWEAFTFGGFSKKLNGGLGECVITLPRSFDQGGPDLQLNVDVELRVSDRETLGSLEDVGGRVVYRGYVSLIERGVDGGRETVTVRALGYWTRLSVDFLKSGSQTTLYSNSTTGLTVTSGSQNAADVSHMVRALMARYAAETSSPKISLNDEDAPNCGVTAKFRFEQKTYREALDDLKSLAPAGIYWYVGESGLLTFKTVPTSPTHRFVFGRHFERVETEHSMEKVRNVLLLWNGESGVSKIYKSYADADSVASYGRRAEAANEYGIDDAAAADAYAAKFLAENREPSFRIVCSILDSNGQDDRGYDIESIQPGDTCRFLGFDADFAEAFRDNMIITGVEYSAGRAVIEVELIKSGVLDFQEKQARSISDIGSGGLSVPESYT